MNKLLSVIKYIDAIVTYKFYFKHFYMINTKLNGLDNRR
jgi:hypothetical protein